MYCAKHNCASYRSATCKVCELEELTKKLAELLQAYREGKASALVVYETSIALQKANEYGLTRKQ